MSYLRGDSYIFFSKELNKYVQTLVISEGAYLNKELLDFGNSKKNNHIMFICIPTYTFIFEIFILELSRNDNI